MFKRLQGERSGGNLPIISKPLDPGGKMGDVTKQEEGGCPEQAGRPQWS